jgi:hypothetical protein
MLVSTSVQISAPALPILTVFMVYHSLSKLVLEKELEMNSEYFILSVMHKLSVIHAIGFYIVTVIDIALLNYLESNLFATTSVTFTSCKLRYFLCAHAQPRWPSILFLQH